MRFRTWVIVLMLVWMHGPASAEFYRYVDEEGNVHYTDDLSKVPVEQRLSVHENAQPEEDFTEEKGTETVGGYVGSGGEALIEAKPVPLEEDILASEGEEIPLGQNLKEIRARLQEEYKALMKEKEEIGEAAKMPLEPTARTKLNERITEHNERIEAYENKTEAFIKEVEAYNARREEGKTLEEKLKETAAKFQEEYETLLKEKEKIDTMAARPLSQRARQELDQKLRDFNARVEDYEKRKQAFDKEVESYNAGIKKEVGDSR